MENFKHNLLKMPKNANFPEAGGETILPVESGKIKMERIFSNCARTDWQVQNIGEWVCVLKGKAVLEFESGETDLAAGDSIFIAKDTPHRVKSTDAECVWLCVYES